MLLYDQALTLAETWVRVVCRGRAEILKDRVLKKPYGWVFFYQSSAYLKSGLISDCLVGNSPIVVDRQSKEIRVMGTARPVDEYLAEYESSLSPACLQAGLPSAP